MSDANYHRFAQRVHAIEDRHNHRGSGFVRLVERNGILAPVEQVRVRRTFPVRGIVLTLLAFMAFKGFLLADLGSVTYADRVSKLEAGTIVEQIGGWAMRADPITIWISEQFGLLF